MLYLYQFTSRREGLVKLMSIFLFVPSSYRTLSRLVSVGDQKDIKARTVLVAYLRLTSCPQNKNEKDSCFEVERWYSAVHGSL